MTQLHPALQSLIGAAHPERIILFRTHARGMRRRIPIWTLRVRDK